MYIYSFATNDKTRKCWLTFLDIFQNSFPLLMQAGWETLLGCSLTSHGRIFSASSPVSTWNSPHRPVHPLSAADLCNWWMDLHGGAMNIKYGGTHWMKNLCSRMSIAFEEFWVKHLTMYLRQIIFFIILYSTRLFPQWRSHWQKKSHLVYLFGHIIITAFTQCSDCGVRPAFCPSV